MIHRLVLTLALGGALVAPALAQTPQPRPPASRAEITLTFAPVVKRAAPAVVNVYAQKQAQRSSNPFMDDPFFRRFFGGQGGPGLGLPGDRVQRSLGSGVIVDPAGIVVTNYHVIEGADEVRISLSDRREFDSEVLLRDQRSDLAVLRIKNGGERFLAIELGDSDELAVGDIVLAVGNPFGVGQTVTQGIVSALARTQVGITDYAFFIQTDAAINPGNSGGALVDMAGRLVGVNTAIFSRSGGSIGIGFAIPANMVRVVVESARGGSAAVKRPWFGARLQPVTAEIAESMGLKRLIGALVANVTPQSPAAKAGLRAGDVIVAIDGQPVDDPSTFNYRFATKPIGGRAQVGYERKGQGLVAAVALEIAPDTSADEIVIRSRSPFAGVKVANLSPALADELRVDAAADGAVIVDVGEGAAKQLGFQRGDLVLSVNGERVTSASDLERLTKEASRVWRITISRGGQQISVMLGG